MGTLHAGLDVSDRTTSICIVDQAGVPVRETTVETDPISIAAALKAYRRRLIGIGQETGTKSSWLHKELVASGWPMVCLDARHVKAALAARPNKTDRSDARGIATLLARGIFTTAHVKSDEAQRMRLLLGTRKALQRKALDLQTSLRMSLKSFGLRVDSKRRRIVAIGKGKGGSDDRFLADLCSVMLRSSKTLLCEVAKLDKLVAEAAANDPICRRFMEIPGVGPLTAMTFRAAVDDPTRFRSSRSVAAYFGLTPIQRQSGLTSVSGPMSRHGDPAVRMALRQAAFVMLKLSHSRCKLRMWGLRVLRRRGSRPAVMACARKLAVVMHRLWVSGKRFETGGVSSDAG